MWRTTSETRNHSSERKKDWFLFHIHYHSSPTREDSRLHACIVCASISCPNVRLRAYQPEILRTQMDDNMRDFLANPKKGKQ